MTTGCVNGTAVPLLEPQVIPPPLTDAITAFGLEAGLCAAIVNGTIGTAVDGAAAAATGAFCAVLCVAAFGVATACGTAASGATACTGALCTAGGTLFSWIGVPFNELDEPSLKTPMFGAATSAPV